VIARLRPGTRRLRTEQAGFTLIELLVASAMGVVLLGAIGSLLISAVREQPKASQKAADIQTARWVLERMTRELRGGFVVHDATGPSVSFETYVRHTACGSSTSSTPATPAIKCEVRYSCASSTCTRTETPPGVTTGGVPSPIFSGLSNASSVFSYLPPTGPGPKTYVRATLSLPSPTGGDGATTISDGASLRNATLSN
jgi:prepilin-type N-terminal cleavage/methylation domain-containing protein